MPKSLPSRALGVRNQSEGPGLRCEGHVLVVEDGDVLRTLIARFLERIGFSVSQSANGDDALASFEALGDLCVLVLLDCRIPGLDSQSVLKAVRKRKPGLPVILMSGYSYIPVSPETEETRPSGFLAKPFGFDTLSSALRSALGGRESGAPVGSQP